MMTGRGKQAEKGDGHSWGLEPGPPPAWDSGFRPVTESKFTQALGKAKGG